MKQFFKAVVLFGCLSFVLSFPVQATVDTGIHQQSGKEVEERKSQVSYLVVLRADQAIISETENLYNLELKNIDNMVLYFSERPVRKAGFMSTNQFMSGWGDGKNSLQVNPPNAAIVYAALQSRKVINNNNMTQAIPIELSSPVVTHDGLMFRMKPLDGSLDIGTFDRISIFIDNVVTWDPRGKFASGGVLQLDSPFQCFLNF